MIFELRCVCGRTIRIDSTRARSRVSCPGCGRPHAVPGVADERLRSNWMVIAGSALAMLLVSATLLWALMASGGSGVGGAGLAGTGPSAGGNIDDPYGGRRNRGREGQDGNESGPGSNKGGEGTQSSVATSQPGPGTQPSPDAEGTQTASTTRPSESPSTQVASTRTFDPGGLVQIDPPPAPPGPAGAPAGGVYGGRGDPNWARQMGATAESEAAVDLGLEWLASVQEQDGSWTYWTRPAERGRGSRGSSYSVGITGLATLAFLGAGHTHEGKSRYATNVRKALEWMVARQDAVGKFKQGVFYEQGIATIAICEAYGMTRDADLKRPAQKALDCVVANMGPNGGYGYRGPGDDVHVTSFQVMAIKSGILAKLEIDKKQSVFGTLRAYYDRGLGPDGTTGYTSSSGRGSRTSARTALGLFCRIFLDVDLKDAKVLRVAEVLHGVGPQLRDVYQTYYGTYGMFQMRGEYWTAWNKRFRDPTIALQIKDEGPLRGSWKLVSSGGRVCTTALYIMSLEVYYRYLPVNK